MCRVKWMNIVEDLDVNFKIKIFMRKGLVIIFKFKFNKICM